MLAAVVPPRRCRKALRTRGCRRAPLGRQQRERSDLARRARWSSILAKPSRVPCLMSDGLRLFGRNAIELVEPLVLCQPDRIALYFEIPAILHGLLVQFTIGGNVAGAVVVARMRNLLARRLQLRDQRFETTADAGQRRGTLFRQFLEKLFVL